MWFGLKPLLWQCVFLFDEEITVYCQAHIPLICIMRSSPAPAPLKCVIQWGEEEEEKIPPHQPNEDGLFSLPGGLWTSHSDGRNTLIVFDNNTRRCEMDRTRRRAAVPAHCSDNHVLSSAECFHRSVMLMFLVLRSKSMCLTSAACVFGEVGVRERGQIQGRGDYQAALDNSQVVDLRGLESDHCLLVCTCSSKKYEKKKFKINNKKVWF